MGRLFQICAYLVSLMISHQEILELQRTRKKNADGRINNRKHNVSGTFGGEAFGCWCCNENPSRSNALTTSCRTNIVRGCKRVGDRSLCERTCEPTILHILANYPQWYSLTFGKWLAINSPRLINKIVVGVSWPLNAILKSVRDQCTNGHQPFGEQLKTS